MTDYQIPERTYLGHVHMKASNLEVVKDFYVNIMGFQLRTEVQGAIFLAAGDYHHHLAFNTWRSEGDSSSVENKTGLYHIAIAYPDRKDLAQILRRLIDHKVSITGASDHGTHEAIYLNDPEGNGLELMWDRPMNQWPRMPNGELDPQQMIKPLDIGGLLLLTQDS